MRSNIIFLVFAALFCMSTLTVAAVMLVGQINTHIEATMIPKKSWQDQILRDNPSFHQGECPTDDQLP